MPPSLGSSFAIRYRSRSTHSKGEPGYRTETLADSKEDCQSQLSYQRRRLARRYTGNTVVRISPISTGKCNMNRYLNVCKFGRVFSKKKYAQRPKGARSLPNPIPNHTVSQSKMPSEPNPTHPIPIRVVSYHPVRIPAMPCLIPSNHEKRKPKTVTVVFFMSSVIIRNPSTSSTNHCRPHPRPHRPSSWPGGRGRAHPPARRSSSSRHSHRWHQSCPPSSSCACAPQ